MHRSNRQYIDLTQTLDSTIPSWDDSCGFQLNTIYSHEKNNICVQNIMMIGGIGTHMDAPFHFIKDGRDIAKLPIKELVAPAVVIDCHEKASSDYFLSVEDIQAHENSHDEITSGSLILIHTGWSQYWLDSKKYRNADNDDKMHFPGISPEATEYLLEKNIIGIGIDTLSPDGSNMQFPVHHLLLGADKYIIENLCNLDKLPAVGATVTALPIKIANAAEAPCRVIAEIEHRS